MWDLKRVKSRIDELKDNSLGERYSLVYQQPRQRAKDGRALSWQTTVDIRHRHATDDAGVTRRTETVHLVDARAVGGWTFEAETVKWDEDFQRMVRCDCAGGPEDGGGPDAFLQLWSALWPRPDPLVPLRDLVKSVTVGEFLQGNLRMFSAGIGICRPTRSDNPHSFSGLKRFAAPPGLGDDSESEDMYAY